VHVNLKIGYLHIKNKEIAFKNKEELIKAYSPTIRKKMLNTNNYRKRNNNNNNKTIDYYSPIKYDNGDSSIAIVQKLNAGIKYHRPNLQRKAMYSVASGNITKIGPDSRNHPSFGGNNLIKTNNVNYIIYSYLGNESF